MTNINQKASLLLSVAAMLLSACGSDPKAASDANFEKALNAHYALKKECFRVGSEPNDAGVIQEFQTDRSRQEKQLPFYNGLVDLGLLETVTYQKDVRTFSGEVNGKSDWVGFKISANGKTYQRSAEFDKGFFSTGTPQLCYGTPQVVEIINFTKPAEVMGVKASSVQYTYKLVDVAPWATDPIIQTHLKWMSDKLVDQSIERDDDLVLTNNGWLHHSAVK